MNWWLKSRSREAAAKVLRDAGWTPEEIAPVMRWKLSYAERVAGPRTPYVSDTPLVDAMGLELSVRAAKAVEQLGVASIEGVRSNIGTLRGMRGVGTKTIKEIEDALGVIK